MGMNLIILKEKSTKFVENSMSYYFQKENIKSIFDKITEPTFTFVLIREILSENPCSKVDS